MRYSETMVAMATRHVAEGEARIQVVRAAIARRRAFGLDTDLVEDLLNTMLATLSLMMDHKAGIEAELKRGNIGPNLSIHGSQALRSGDWLESP